MKNFSYLLAMFLLFFGYTQLPAQESQKADDTKKKESKTETPVNKEMNTGFKDLNANGIDDTQETEAAGAEQQQHRKRVRFIDTDGDGICDGRASGAGIKLRMHGTTKKQLQKGKNK